MGSLHFDKLFTHKHTYQCTFLSTNRPMMIFIYSQFLFLYVDEIVWVEKQSWFKFAVNKIVFVYGLYRNKTLTNTHVHPSLSLNKKLWPVKTTTTTKNYPNTESIDKCLLNSYYLLHWLFYYRVFFRDLRLESECYCCCSLCLNSSHRYTC